MLKLLPDVEQAGPSNWSLVRRMLALSWRYRFGCLKALSLQLAATLLGLAALAASGLGIDLIHHEADHVHPEPRWPLGFEPPDWPPLATVALIAGAVLAIALLRAWLTFAYHIAAARLVHEQIVVDLRTAVYDKLQRLSFRFFDNHTTGSVINRVTGDVQSVRMFVDGVIIQLLIVLLSLVTYLGYMLSIHAGLTLVCLATTPLLWIASALFSRVVRPAYDRNRELVDRLVLTLSENIQGMHVVKGFARETAEIGKFAAANDAVQSQQQRIFWRVSLYTPTVGILTQINLFLLLAYGGYLVIHDQLPLGTGLIVFVGLLQQFSTQVNNIAGIANSILQSLTGARRVFEILDAPIEVDNLSQPLALGRAAGQVTFESVSFGYTPGRPVLKELNFTIEPGQCVAVVGATGAGKSSLLNLIARFYDPTRGRVLIDGVDARRLELSSLRRNIGIVFQESFLFSNTVAANIAFGRPLATREQIVVAARLAQAHEFIERLPQGYDTVLGEGGSDLSGGQRQRLAIARAMLLEPSILLLDDPTAAIDSQTEQEILAAMEVAMQGRTTFVVAHRNSTLRRADLVLVLEQGRIVRIGPPEEIFAGEEHLDEAARLQEAA
jgi:ATP-binding cassette subfamily B protein